MLDFDHPNVMRLVGVCFDTKDKLPLIVLPYMANGDLKTFLRGKRLLNNGRNPDDNMETYPPVNIDMNVPLHPGSIMSFRIYCKFNKFLAYALFLRILRVISWSQK